MKTRNKKTRKNKRTRRLKLAVAGLIGIACLLLVLYFILIGSSSQKLQTGQLDSSQTHPGEALRQSLDLRIAAKADYPSSPLSIYQDLPAPDGLKEQLVRFSVASDGLNEFALLMEPASSPPAGGYPAIILCHGYVNPAKYSTTLAYAGDMEFYARHGFAVIKPDFRGQGQSINQGSANSAYYSMDYNTDVMSLISSLKQTKDINSNNLNLWGHSMGAYIALRASVLSPDIKRAILLSGPVATLSQMYLNYVPPSDENNPVALKTRAEVFSKYGTPGENTAFWKDASPINFLGNTATRYQIHVGAQDAVVPPVFSSELNDALSALKRSHQYYVYDQAGHGLEPQRPLVWSRSLDLLRQS